MAWEDLGEDTVGKQGLSSIVSTFSLTLLTPVSLITEVRSQHWAQVTQHIWNLSGVTPNAQVGSNVHTWFSQLSQRAGPL